MSGDIPIVLSDLDQVKPVYNIIITACFIVNGRLDTDRLHDSLDGLVARWPLLSARVTHNKATGRYGLRVPGEYSNGRKAFIFTTDHTDTPFPNMPSRKAGINPDMQTILKHFRTASTPRATTDLLKQADAPMLHVHVHYFSDVTAIGFHIPHLFSDVPGVTEILRAWCKLISNPDEDVKLPRLIEGNALGAFGEKYPKTPEGRALFHSDMVSTASIWEGFWQKVWYWMLLIFFVILSKEEGRLLFIPQSVVDKHRKEVMDVHAKRVSENDVISALLVKLHLFTRPSTPKHLTVSFSANLRKRLPVLSQSDAVYLHNALFPMCAKPAPLETFQSMSVSELALLIRRTIELQRPIEQIEKNVAVHRESARLNVFPNYGPPSGTDFYITSWAVGNWGEMDFSGAVLEKGAIANAGRLRFAAGACCEPSGVTAGRSRWSIIMSKMPEEANAEAGYWCELGATPKSWPEIEKVVSSWTV